MGSMKDCSKVQSLLAEYVDGVLEGEAAWDVKLHLSSCAVCSRIADDFRATSRLLGTLERAEPSASFEDALSRRLADLSLKPRPATPWERVRSWWSEQSGARRPALASAAALAAIVPLALVIAGQRAGQFQARTGASPAPRQIATGDTRTARGEDTLRELWGGHSEYASSLPLGDQAALLTTESEL